MNYPEKKNLFLSGLIKKGSNLGDLPLSLLFRRFNCAKA